VTKINFQLGGTLCLVTEEGHSLVTIRYDNFSITARGENMAYTLPVGKQVEVQVAYMDANGNPATVDGIVAWDSSDPSIVDVLVDDNDTTLATVRAQGALGLAQVSATADADLGQGVRTLVTTMDVTCVAGEAVAGTITPVGEPVDIPVI
jgi:hypothetical protein